MYQNIDKLTDKVDSRFTLVILAARRAREINDYLTGIKRGEFVQVRGPQISMISEKPLTIAFQEIAEDRVSYERLADGIK